MGAGGLLRRILSVDEWKIGVADIALEDLVKGGNPGGAHTVRPHVRWLPKPWFVRVQADPCVVEDDGRLFLYYEDLVAGSAKGRLRCTELSADGTVTRRDSAMMRLPHHAAYPFVFRHLEAFYCVPEMGSINRVVLYRSVTPLGPWIQHSVLLEGVSARDSNICWFADRWWLFCTVAGPEPRSRDTNLHIWHAPEPWGPWEPHRSQPAKSDIHSARPAGRPFTVDGVIYRPGQDCGNRYGLRMVINRVLALTPDAFAEEICCFLEPDPQERYRDGLHTITSAGGLVFVDGCHSGPTPNPFKTAAALVAKARGKIARAAVTP